MAGTAVQQNVPAHIRNGVMLTDISVMASGRVVVSHRLGRKLTGWQIQRPRGTGHVHETASDDKTLTLTEFSGAALTFNIWVY